MTAEMANKVEDGLSSSSSPFLKSQIPDTIELYDKLKRYRRIEVDSPVRFCMKYGDKSVYCLDRIELSFPYILIPFISFHFNDLASIGCFTYNLRTEKVRYFFNIKKKPLGLEFKDIILPNITEPIINLDRFCDSIPSISNRIDDPGRWIHIEGHRNVVIGSKVSDSGDLKVMVCTTNRNTYELSYDKLIKVDDCYWSVFCGYSGKLSAHKCFSESCGFSNTFRHRYHKNWLYRERERFLYNK